MNKSLEERTVHAKGNGLVQSRMSRCLFGDWPRRMVLKLALPVKEEPLSLPSCKEGLSTAMKPCKSREEEPGLCLRLS